MTEEEFQARLVPRQIALKSLWIRIDKELDLNIRAGWMRRADTLQQEIIDLEEQHAAGKRDQRDDRPVATRFRFYCPYCDEQGTIARAGLAPHRSIAVMLPKHDYVGDGKFLCFAGGKQIFQEAMIFDLESADSPTSDDSPTITWLEYHDQLLKEYLDGERVLIEELMAPEIAAHEKHVRERINADTNRRLLAVSALITAWIVFFAWILTMIF